MDPSKPSDDLDAVRMIAAALSPFKPPEQERILRWAREKVGLATTTSTDQPDGSIPGVNGKETPGTPQPAGLNRGLNIRDFVEQKKPSCDMHFATVVAYYHRFEAAEADRKDAITSEDLQEACRKAGRDRLIHPSTTLHNALKSGLLDKAGRGAYTVNSVGENLVAMALPEKGDGVVPLKATGRNGRRSRAPRRKKPRAKK